MLLLSILIGLVAVGAITAGNSLKVIKQYERGVVFRLGRVTEEPRDPGLTAVIPFIDKLHKTNMQIITLPIPAQEGITRDNVTVRVDAVIYFKVVDPRKAIVDVEDYQLAVGQVAQTSLRSIIGQSELDDLLTNRERLNQGLAIMIDSPAVDWGVHIDRVEIKDVALPESMKRSMSRQAEAERERRSRVIIADGELQASNKLSQAAEAMANTPSALQLRLLQTIVEVAAERNSTLVLPFPVELLRFLESNTPDRNVDHGAAESLPTEPGGPSAEVRTPPEKRGIPAAEQLSESSARGGIGADDLSALLSGFGSDHMEEIIRGLTSASDASGVRPESGPSSEPGGPPSEPGPSSEPSPSPEPAGASEAGGISGPDAGVAATSTRAPAEKSVEDGASR